jgi:hypothetical protein
MLALTVKPHEEGSVALGCRRDQCRAVYDAASRTGYCCGFDIQGQHIMVTGYAIDAPRTGLGPPERFCRKRERTMPVPGATGPTCTFNAPWREAWEDVAGVAVTDVCVLD